MLKFFITGIIIYFIYQTFIKKPSLKEGRDQRRSDPSDHIQPSSSKNQDDDEGEYIDYEEVE